MPSISSLDRIQQLKAEIAQLEQAAIQELMDRRNALTAELAAVDAEIERLTGKAPAARRTRATAGKAAGKAPSLQELKEILDGLPENTLSIRKEGYDLTNIKGLVNANPGLLKLGGKGPWPTVSLLK